MCNFDCCALKTALDHRRVRLLAEKLLKEELANPPKILLTPPTLLYSYEQILAMAQFVVARSQVKPKFGIICGRLSSLAQMVDNPVIIDYAEIPGFPICTAPGNESKLYMGHISGAPVILMSGRFHPYEGIELFQCAVPVRMMKLCGIEYLITSCAAAAVDKSYNVGDVLLVKDHINIYGLMGHSALIGPNDARFGPKHKPMVNCYDRKLLARAIAVGESLGFQEDMHIGIYACMGGPAEGTAAEEQLLRRIGANAVGVGMVHEPSLDRDISTILQHTEYGKYVCTQLIGHIIYSIQFEGL
ncbi:CG18128 [Drosophila busckii]|uniref:purine-nucleoside phosphorylase n=1 Tax=Drosophila busckii TaxID=30019 RepID=A0A0M4EEY9_DROBS|nr:CG18128 [Drosophila busckii]